MAPSKLNLKQDEPTKIPRPLNSFMIFRLEKQREIVGQCPGANHRDMSKIISKWWRELVPEKKQIYIDQAEHHRSEHKRLYPNYKFAPKKRTSAARPYKKRPDTELIARDFDDKQQLLSLYHHGKDVSPVEKNALINYVENTKPKQPKNQITKSRKSEKNAGVISFNCSPPSPNSYLQQSSSSIIEDNHFLYNNQLLCPTDTATSPSTFSLLSHHSAYSPSLASISSSHGPHSTLLQDLIDPSSPYFSNYATSFNSMATTSAGCFINQGCSFLPIASDPIFDDNAMLMVEPIDGHRYLHPFYHQPHENTYHASAPVQLLAQPFFHEQEQKSSS